MYQLYYSPGACSLAVHSLLIELGQSVELVKTSLSEGENRKPEYLAINPRGQVPVLVDNGKILREGASIMLYLMEKYNSPLLPKSFEERSEAIEWLLFMNSTMHPAYGRVFYLLKQKIDKETQDMLVKGAITYINKLWVEVDQRLAKKPYISGEKMGAADILLAVIGNWGTTFAHPVVLGDNIKRVINEVKAMPSFQKALAEEKVEYKAA